MSHFNGEPILLLVFISFHLFWIFCVLFLQKVCKDSIVQGFNSIPEEKNLRVGRKMETLVFFHETRLISLVWVSTTLVKPGISLPRPQSVSAPYPQSAGRRLRNPISSSVAAPTFASQCYRRDFFFQNGFGKNM